MAFPNTERSGKMAHVRYRGGVQGQPPEDVCWEEPTTIRMGVGEVIRGIDEALYDMQVGETRTVVLPPEKAYGEHDPAGVQRFLRRDFPNGDEIYEGFVGSWVNPVSRRRIPAICTKTTEDFIQVDFNHPFAGKTLEYEIELLSIIDE